MKINKQAKYIISVILTVFISTGAIYAWNGLQAESGDTLSHTKWNELVNSIGSGTIDGITSVGGKIGIGTVSPSFETHIKSSGINTTLAVEASTNNKILIHSNNNGNNRIYARNGLNSYGTLEFWSGTDRETMRIEGNGNVGIGTKTPSSDLDIVSDNDTGLFIRSTGLTDFDAEIGLENKEVLWKITNDDDYLGNLHIYNHDVLGGGSYGSINTSMMFTKDGKVGIGTTNPQRKLHISGDGGYNSQIRMERTDIGKTCDIYMGDGGCSGSDINLGNQNGVYVCIACANN